jgi:hypothetical protein
MNRLILAVTLLIAGVVLPAAKAEALAITPATLAAATGDQTSQAEIDAAIAAFLGISVELYKQNVGGAEEGALAGSYTTEFFNTPDDPEDATITYDGGDIVGPIAYLLIKDGASSPAWYLFNLTSLGWNGMETIEIQDFWAGAGPAGRGAISHLTLYGGTTSVPEPATLSLLAVGLLGTGVLRRRRSHVA